jgi:glycosyltransferase involved in cell wall biosynthesis
MIVPLQSGSGLRIKIVEGLAYGKAIVSTNIGAEGIPLCPGDNSILENNPVAFADQIIRLLTEMDLLTNIQRGARKFAEEHLDNQKITKELVAFYQSLN